MDQFSNFLTDLIASTEGYMTDDKRETLVDMFYGCGLGTYIGALTDGLADGTLNLPTPEASDALDRMIDTFRGSSVMRKSDPVDADDPVAYLTDVMRGALEAIMDASILLLGEAIMERLAAVSAAVN